MQENGGLKAIDFEKSMDLLKGLQNHWICIKLILHGPSSRNCASFKFRLNILETLDQTLFLYGGEDDERLIINIREIIQIMASYEEDEVFFKIENIDGVIDLFIRRHYSVSNVKWGILNNRRKRIFTDGKTEWKQLKILFEKSESN